MCVKERGRGRGRERGREGEREREREIPRLFSSNPSFAGSSQKSAMVNMWPGMNRVSLMGQYKSVPVAVVQPDSTRPLVHILWLKM